MSHIHPIPAIILRTRLTEKQRYRIRIRSTTGAVALKYLGYDDLKPRVLCADGKNTKSFAVRFPEIVLWSCAVNPVYDKYGNPKMKGKIELLDCSNNKLTDICTRSNPGLKRLYCAFNGLRTLHLSSELPFPGLEEIEYLDCSHNLLGTLDVSTLPHLETLICCNNKLKFLRFGKACNLGNIDCRHNLLSLRDLCNNQGSQDLYAGTHPLCAGR
jgi:hypothetical protein